MLFNGFAFIGLFLPVMLLLFWLVPGDGAKRAVLLLGSLFFYGYFFWPYLFLLVGLVGVAWACALLVERGSRTGGVWVASLLLLGTLAYFKYAGFLAEIAADAGLIGAGTRRVHDLALPIGISFIVFQALGYVIDVRRGEFKAEPRFSMVLLFKAFFPQLIAGPICRAHELIPQLRAPFRFDLDRVVGGFATFALGFVLKEVFADGLAPLVDTLYARPDSLGWVEAWAAAIGFAFQIFADFWGYSTMAVGLARMFNIDIPVNFHLPYFARSLREFWRRWHITLSQWLRDYLYKPLGGSWHGPWRTAVALMVTMLLGGIWHGANYTFVVWGALHGGLLLVEHAWSKRRVRAAIPAMAAPALAFAGWVYASVAVLVAWVFFRAAHVSDAANIVQSMFRFSGSFSISSELRQIFILSVALFVVQWPVERLLERLREDRVAAPTSFAIAFWAMLAGVVLGAPAAVPFIYFQF